MQNHSLAVQFEYLIPVAAEAAFGDQEFVASNDSQKCRGTGKMGNLFDELLWVPTTIRVRPILFSLQCLMRSYLADAWLKSGYQGAPRSTRRMGARSYDPHASRWGCYA